jgi:hypothetical protein
MEIEHKGGELPSADASQHDVAQDQLRSRRRLFERVQGFFGACDSSASPFALTNLVGEPGSINGGGETGLLRSVQRSRLAFPRLSAAPDPIKRSMSLVHN